MDSVIVQVKLETSSNLEKESHLSSSLIKIIQSTIKTFFLMNIRYHVDPMSSEFCWKVEVSTKNLQCTYKFKRNKLRIQLTNAFHCFLLRWKSN
jgi:hypothetical protein